jgi:hypothetical protein
MLCSTGLGPIAVARGRKRLDPRHKGRAVPSELRQPPLVQFLAAGDLEASKGTTVLADF